MEKTDEKLASLIEKLQDAGFAQAPEVIDGAIRAIHWDGVIALGFVTLFFGLLLASLILLIYGARKENGDITGVGAVGAMVSLILALLFGTAQNPWLKTFDPQAALYQQMIEGIF